MTPTPDLTAEDVASWMARQLASENYLYQETAVATIAERFGERFVYHNQNGNLAIARDVLAAFRRLTEGTVVWERAEKCWRRREEYDEPGRRQS